MRLMNMLSVNAALTFCLHSKAHHQCRACSALVLCRFSSLNICGCTIYGCRSVRHHVYKVKRCILQLIRTRPGPCLATQVGREGHTVQPQPCHLVSPNFANDTAQQRCACKLRQFCPHSYLPLSHVMAHGHWSCCLKLHITKAM